MPPVKKTYRLPERDPSYIDSPASMERQLPGCPESHLEPGRV